MTFALPDNITIQKATTVNRILFFIGDLIQVSFALVIQYSFTICPGTHLTAG
jgi:hypothetical protein